MAAVETTSAGAAAEPLLRVESLAIRFQGRDGAIHAVNGVDFALAPGRVLVLLGESGSGKSVTLKALMRLYPPKRTLYQGRIRFAGQNVLELSEDA
jgi:peptide/nickel transport system ATP-binding protein